MGANIASFSRSLKVEVSDKLHQNLVSRKQNGPDEPGLDVFIIELADVSKRLNAHLSGKLTANAARSTRVARLEVADVNVDRWYRHIENYLSVEANRRIGPHVEEAAAVYRTACPDGLAHVDDAIVDENRYCRNMIKVLRAPENQAVLAAIEFPMMWLDKLEAALDESDAALADVQKARGEQGAHVDMGRDAEEEWIDVITRLRKYVGSRARRGDVEKQTENKLLLQPLLDEIQKQKSVAAGRATRREKAAEASAKEAEPTAEVSAPSAPSAPNAPNESPPVAAS